MKRLFAFLMSAAMLASLCACGSGGKTTSSEPEPTKAPYEPVKMAWKDVDGDGVIRVACVGDSITQGTDEANWPDFLQSELNYLSQTDGNTYEVRNHGKAGAAVHHVLENYPEFDTDGDGMSYFYYDDPKYTSALTYTPDVVIVQFGSNDGLGDPNDPNSNAGGIENYFKSDYYNYLVKPFLDKGSFVVVATPPHAANGWVDIPVNGRISEMVREMAAENNLGLVDMNKITEGHPTSFPDGIHGNASGYALISLSYYNQIFGGAVRTLDVDTGDAHGAIVSLKGLTIVSGGAEREMDLFATTDDNGKATVIMLEDGAEHTFLAKATCEEFKNYEASFVLSQSGEIKFDLIPGQYNVTGDIATATADSVCNICDTVVNEDGTKVGTNVAQNVLDGSRETRWESGHHNNAWLLVDLGTVKNINGVKLDWEGAYSTNYDVLVSTDGENFTTAASVNLNHDGIEITTFEAVDARYIKINCKTRYYGAFGNSIYEFQALSDVKQ